eukprot:9979-Heterococcus_DN1.PRE.2
MSQQGLFGYPMFRADREKLHANPHPRYLYQKCKTEKDKVLCAQQEAEHMAAVWRNTFGGICSFPSLTRDSTKLEIIDNYYKAAYASIDNMRTRIEQGEVDRIAKRDASEAELYATF